MLASSSASCHQSPQTKKTESSTEQTQSSLTSSSSSSSLSPDPKHKSKQFGTGFMNNLSRFADSLATQQPPLSPNLVNIDPSEPNSPSSNAPIMSLTQVSSSTPGNAYQGTVNPNQLLSSAIAAVTLKPNSLHHSSSLQNTSTNGYYDMQALANTNSTYQAKSNMIAKAQQPNSKYPSSFNDEQFHCIQLFESWAAIEQTEFVENLLRRMCHFQHGHINNFLRPMLQRDFISLLPSRGLLSIAEMVLSYLDDKSLCAAELVCKEWMRVIWDGQLWKKLIERQVNTDTMWRGLSEHRGWAKYLYKINYNNLTSIIGYSSQEQHCFYKSLYSNVIKDIKQVNQNWAEGNCITKKIHCRSENSKGVYCLQYDNEKIISGLRDNTIKIWDKKQGECIKTLSGHSGSVLCLQYDQNMIVSGSSDTSVRVWDIKTGQNVNTLHNHKEAVLHLRFLDGIMVTCSKDRQIIVWDINSPTEIQVKRTLVGHRAAVNVVDFDNRYIVSASGDRTIKVWHTSTCEFVRTLTGHKRGIACLQYRGNLVVSGSSDFTIRIWDIESGECLRVLEGHDELVRCIRFDNNRIVSGAYDGKIKIWDLKAALEQRLPPQSLCLRTLTEHTGRVFRLQFDEFQIVSSSHDDTIIIWDFLNYPAKTESAKENASSLPTDSNPWANSISPSRNQQQRNLNYSPSSPLEGDD